MKQKHSLHIMLPCQCFRRSKVPTININPFFYSGVCIFPYFCLFSSPLQGDRCAFTAWVCSAFAFSTFSVACPKTAYCFCCVCLGLVVVSWCVARPQRMGHRHGYWGCLVSMGGKITLMGKNTQANETVTVRRLMRNVIADFRTTRNSEKTMITASLSKVRKEPGAVLCEQSMECGSSQHSLAWLQTSPSGFCRWSRRVGST